jgi:predicted DNA-binding transcriptional regulator AlpA
MNNGGTITLNDVSRILGKSKRTVSRWIKAGKLKPKKIKSKKGAVEYRFSKSAVESLRLDISGQVTAQNDIISVFIKQLEEKDKQIGELLDRQRETNILIGRLQEQVLQLDNKPKDKGAVRGFFDRLFNH